MEVPSYIIVLTTIIRNQVTKLLIQRVHVIDHYNYRHNAYSHVYDHMHNCPIITVRLCASR